MLTRYRIRRPVILAVGWMLLASAPLIAKTSPALDVVVEKFKTEPNAAAQLDLAYEGLDKYAPLREKSETDRDDRDALCRMKTLLLGDLLQKPGFDVVLTATGSAGAWLLDANLVNNTYDYTRQDEIAKLKQQGYYMEGLSDLDFSIMGPDARRFAAYLAESLAAGRKDSHIIPEELENLEISFVVDEQITNLSSAGDSRRFWRQMLDVERSSYHPEKYITKGGKALYCIEHLAIRGAAIIPGEKVAKMRFADWAASAGHELGPFTPQYLYGGCCDMDYFLVHAAEKGQQEKIKTVMQIIKYLERQGWMCQQAFDNAGKLPQGIEVLPERISNLEDNAARIEQFCARAVGSSVWQSDGDYAKFAADAVKLSGQVCLAAHSLSIGLGRDLLIKLDMGKVSPEEVMVLDEIAYDLRIVHTKRYHRGRPAWYESHEYTVKEETTSFLADYENRKAKVFEILVKAGFKAPRDPELDIIEVGPILPPPVVTVEINNITIEPNRPRPGSSVRFTATGKIEGAVTEEPNWSQDYFTGEQREATRQVALWSWLAAVRRMEIQHLMNIDQKNDPAGSPADQTYVSPYEIAQIAEEELEPCEDEIFRHSKVLGEKSPQTQIGRIALPVDSAPTFGSPEDYLETVNKSVKDNKDVFEAINVQARAIIYFCKNVENPPEWLSRVNEIFTEIQKDVNVYITNVSTATEYYEKYKGYTDDVKNVFKGDIGTITSKAKELEEYLDGLGDETELAILDATAMQNRLANGINLFRTTLPTVDYYRFPGLRTGLIDGIREYDKQKNKIVLEQIPPLEERALWLSRGAFAAKSARYALTAVQYIQQYREVSDSLSTSDLSAETESAVKALSACGEVFEWASEFVPIKALQESVKQYAGLLKSAPQWSAAFDKMLSRAYQYQGYDVRSVLLPEAYESLMKANPGLEPGQFYRYNGAFAQYNGFIVFGHPTPEPGYLQGKKSDSPTNKVDVGRDRLWLIWDKTKPNGFLRLSPETYRKASLYAAWYRRVYGRPISPIELHDLLTSEQIMGGYVTKSPVVTVSQLKQQAETALRIEAVAAYLGGVLSEGSFTPDQLRHYYALLDQSARRLSDEGFIIDDEDVRAIIAGIQLDPTISGNWATTLRYLPAGEAFSALVNKGTEVYDSISSGEKERFENALAKRIEEKKQLRVDARKRFWENARKSAPADLLLKDIRIMARHTLAAEKSEYTRDEFLKPGDPNFTIVWDTTLPADANRDTSYICRVSIMGYEKSVYDKDLVFDVNKPEEPAEPTEKPKVEQKPQQEDDCPIPKDAWLYDVPTIRAWRVDNHEAGPCTSWYDKERKLLASKICYDANGREHGVKRHWHRNGKLKYEGAYIHGNEVGVHTDYYDNAVIHIQETWINGKKNGPHIRYDKQGKLDDDQGEYVNDRREGLWKHYYYGALRWETNYKNGKREGLETNYGLTGQVTWYSIYENDRPVKNLDKNMKVTKIIEYFTDANGMSYSIEKYP